MISLFTAINLFKFAVGTMIIATACYLWVRRNGGELYPAIVVLFAGVGAMLSLDVIGQYSPDIKDILSIFETLVVCLPALKVILVLIKGK